MTRSLLLLILLLAPAWIKAQFTYVMNQSIPVKDSENNIIPMPWAGGINAAQFNTMDLNGDNNPDLVLFDRMTDKVLTYLNKNNKYQYAPEFESLFPTDLSSWILLRDYNGDGRKDIFTGNINGIKVYTNTTLPDKNISWQAFLFYNVKNHTKSEALLTKGFNGLVNLQLQYDDLPSISDMDGDGDLDILNVVYSGTGTFEYHENFSERYNTMDSIVLERQTQAWGNVTECNCGLFAFNGVDCSSLPSGRTKHAGGKSLLAIDVDGDLDLDVLFSEASCTDLYLLKNEGTTANPVFNTSSMFPGSNPSIFSIFPSPYYEDLDFDGVKDLLTSPNIYKKSYLTSELDASNWFYKNMGSNADPNFALQSKTFLQDQMIDLGDNSVPAFADADGDGDFDLFISENFTQDSQTSLVYFYENTGTTSKPEFKLKNTDYLGFSSSRLYNLKIQFADLNADGKIDLAFTASKWTDSRPFLYYFSNTSSTGVNFTGQPVPTGVMIAFDENIYITDVGGGDNDKPDGKPDLLIGKSGGSLEYWVNNGSLKFSLKSSSYLGLGSTVKRQNPSCAVGDLDNDGKKDIIISEQRGSLKIVSDYLSVSDLSTAISNIILSPLQDSIYAIHNLGGSNWPTVVNLFQTDKPAVVVGNTLGGVYILENNAGKIQLSSGVQIYPNPVSTTGILKIRVAKDCFLQVYSSLGQPVNGPVSLIEQELHTYRISDLSSGIYFFKFTFSNKSVTKRIVVN